MNEVSVPPASKTNELNELVLSGLKSLDLSPQQYDKAISEYCKITTHLEAKEGFCSKWGPDVYPQGSMDLGTCIKPIGREEFDLDMVVAALPLPGQTFETFLDDLNSALSDLTGSFTEVERMPCCIRFHYPGDFHLDLVPAFKNPTESNPEAIILASKKGTGGTPSDPKAFAEEFSEAKARVLTTHAFSANEKVANSQRSITVAPEPDRVTAHSKTTLQTVVQLLKRHCALYFKDRDDRPSSSILTALCADCYLGHQDLYEATGHALQCLDRGINPDEPRVPNPRYHSEDFADRWKITPPNRESAFHDWLVAARTDFARLGQLKLHNASQNLEPWLGKRASATALQTYDEQGVSERRRTGSIGFAASAGLAGASSTVKAAAPTSFCGDRYETD